MREAAQVAVVGATGYAGFELARLLLRHPWISKPTFYLRGNSARCLTEVFPQLRGWGEAPCRPLSAEAVARSGAELVFLSIPHEASIELAPQLLGSNAALRIVDLSGAFRFRDPAVFSKWYALAAAPHELLEEAVYGLPELDRREQIRKARIVANPGCYATSVILGLRPLAEAGWIDRGRGIVCDCKSGVTGAGKEPKRETQFAEANENLRAYNVFGHRHTPEITENLDLDTAEVIFTTHLLPVDRGILSTLSVWLAEPRTAAEIEALYRGRYDGWPLVRIWSAGTLPELKHVTGTNFCDIGFALAPDGQRLVVVSCLDNLGKGAAGQAVQNMNEMLAGKLSEHAGFSPEAGLL